MKFYDVLKAPFAVYGLWGTENGGTFRRIPVGLADKLGTYVPGLATNSSGGRVLFRTDAQEMTLRVKLDAPQSFSHFSAQGMTGCDLYVAQKSGWELHCPFIPAVNATEYEFSARLCGEMREYMLYLPLYAGPLSVEIGLPEQAAVGRAAGYSRPPVGFYGSSITQGACASRAGLAYHNILSRMLGTDVLNLGFSGSAKGEPEMAEFVAGRKMSAFVFDYDYNAPTAAHLAATHWNFYETVRKAQPDLPVLMLTACSYGLSELDERRAIIRADYERAKAAGDRVWFYDGDLFFGKNRAECTVDLTHPNDWGMYRMAEGIAPILAEMLEI